VKKQASHLKISTTYQVHKRQATWQIILPLVLAAVILLTVGTLAGVGAFNEPVQGTRWASISMILLIIPVLLSGAMLVLVITGVIYGLTKLYQVVPTYSLLVRSYTFKAAFFVRQWSDRIIKPLFLPKIIQAGIHGFFSVLKNPENRQLKKRL